MKQRLPSRVEMILFIAVALVCGLIASLSSHRDYALGGMGMTVFLVASLMGLRRGDRLSRQDDAAAEE